VTPLLEARGLVVSRGDHRVLHGVGLALASGEAVALVGPNAAGKSTLVRALAGLLRHDAGDVFLDGRPLSDWPRDALARTLALVSSGEDGAGALTVRERVALGRYPHRGPFRPLTGEDEGAVERALQQTGIHALGGRRLETLSAGERQLAALARGLAQEPRVLLLDEPGAHLDVGHQLQLFRVLDGVRGCGVGILAVVHDLQRAATWADRMLLLEEGRMADEGAPPDVLAGSACARAFGVEVRGHSLPGLSHLLYSFEDKRP
jgi:ABC-type cobalamin/Fe3+-siderophores transport system ATPase subunit